MPAEPAPARRAARHTPLAIALVLAGILLCALAQLARSREGHSYAAGSTAPQYVSLSAGRSYAISVHGGVVTEQDDGLDPASLACTITAAGSPRVPLTVTAEVAGTKEENQIGSFVSPVSGRAHVACSGLVAVFVDDADDASPDFSLFLLLLGVIALATGGPLLVSAALRGVPSSRAAWSGGPGQDQQVE